jgi:citrate synthase
VAGKAETDPAAAWLIVESTWKDGLVVPKIGLMMKPRTDAANGLEGIVVADTRLSDVDGNRGRLIVGGRDVETLAGHVSFEKVCALLWGASEASVRAALGRGRQRAWARLSSLGDALDAADGMEALRTAISHLRGTDEACNEDIVGAMAVFLAAWNRGRHGAPPRAPDPSLGHAADLFRMAFEDAPAPSRVAALETYLVTVVEHGMNASTFAARVVASTGADTVSAVVAAIGALKGPLHGGAPGPVLDMLDAIGEPANAVDWLAKEVAAGRRIMGMGHRVYRVRDPRAAVLENALVALVRSGCSTPRLALARAVEQAAVGVLRAKYPDRPLLANVEFYTAVLLDALGVPRTLFTPMFAASRAAGWCAHVAEQRANGRLIRPASRYVGPMPEATAPVSDAPAH